MKTVLFLISLALVVWFWQHSLAIRERAIARCRRMCRELNLQFLDQTVALAGIMPHRRKSGAFELIRRYNFEFSTVGSDRHRGHVIMSGTTVIHLQLEHPDGGIISSDDRRGHHY